MIPSRLAHRPRGDDHHTETDGADRFAELARTGAPTLRAAIIADNLPMAHRIARRFARGSDRVEDLMQVAALALVKAVDRFDPSAPNSFVAFAVPTIMGELKRHLRDCGWGVRAPRRLQELHLAVVQAAERLTQELGRAPRPTELAHRLGVPEDAVMEALEAGAAHWCTSLDATVDGDEPLSATLAGRDRHLDRAADMATLAAALRQLPPRQRRIVELRFLHDRTQAEIAAEIGLSQMHVSRLLAQTLQALRTHMADGGA